MISRIRSPFLRFLRVFLAVAAVLHAGAPEARADWYKVGEGDTLNIDFPLQSSLEDLRPLAGNGLSLVAVGNLIYWRYQVTVAPDGHITLPSLDPIQVAGLKLSEVREKIIKSLESSPKNALVSVGLAESDSAAFFVWGEVREPGRFPFQRPTSVMEAIGMAGGATADAKLENVLLLRADDPPVTLNFSHKKMARTGPPFMALRPSDTIVIPRRPFATNAFTTGLFVVLSIIGTGAAVAAASK